MKFILNIFILTFLVECGYSQIISGTVRASSGETLEGVQIKWLGDTIGTVSVSNGKFELKESKSSDKLISSFLGYLGDTISIQNGNSSIEIILSPVQQLKEVTISSKRQDTYISTLQTRNIETLTSCELKNAPCCSLSESFETNATVDVVQTDAVTGTKEIQMLGLKGVYTQVLIENRPDLGGIVSSYAMDFIPGTWIDAIQISKGASTVANGFQSISGQINAELIKPFNSKPLFFNAFSNHEGRYEFNLHLNHKNHSPWSQGLLLHTSGQQNRGDHDKDSFIENVLRTTYSGLYRLFYSGKVWNTQFNILATNDSRKSGQYTHKSEFDKEDSFYHITQQNKRYEVFGKLAYLGLKGKQESIGFQWHAIKHEINNFIGFRTLNARETDVQGTLLYKNNIINDDNIINIGLTGQLNDISQNFDQNELVYNDRTSGLHAEYAYSSKGFPGEKSKFMQNLGAVLGLRLDYHSHKGWFIVPRLNLKYNFSDESIIRFSIGRGLRRARPFTDNVNRMANNRTWVVEPNLPLEDALNMGGNFTQSFSLNKRSGQFAIDVYKVIFQNQVIFDADADLNKIIIYSLAGNSQASTIQLSSQYEIFNGLNVRAAYKYSNVKIDYLEGYRDAIFIPRDRWLFTAIYKTPNNKWQINGLANYTGKMRLPDIDGIPAYLLHGSTEISKPFWRFDLQITYFASSFEIFSGIENITNYRQHLPIVEHDNPFDKYFDAGRVYAPLNGRMFNLGVRLWLDKDHHDDHHD